MASSGNFCTINPIGAQGNGTIETGTVANGNLSAVIDETCFGTMGVTSGKWYWEWALTSSAQSGMAVGWANNMVTSSSELGYNSPSSETGAQIVYVYLSKNPPEIISDAPKSASDGTDTSMSEISQNDIIGLAADFDNDKWYFSINGSFTNARSGQDPATGANPLCSATGGGGLVTIARTAGFTWFPAFGNWAAATRNVKVNFGQDSTFSASFSAGGNADENGFGDFKYTVPTGFLALCSANLPISDDIDPAQTSTDYPSKNFNVVTYTGDGSTSNAISNLGFSPDMVWIGQRSSPTADYSNGIWDTTRGRAKLMYSSRSNAEPSDSSSTQDLVSFDSDGFTVGTNNNASVNASSKEMVGWCWKANGGTTSSDSSGDITVTRQSNTKGGFAILTYSGNGSSDQTIAHGLGKTPAFIITKNRSSTSHWAVWHQSYTGNYGQLEDTGAWASDSSQFYTNGMTSNFIGVKGSGATNESGDDMIAYVWTEIDGFSKFGSYGGNGNSDGTFVFTGVRPRLLMIRNVEQSSNWGVYDSARQTFNPNENYLRWNSGVAEGGTGNSNDVDFLSNGFKVRSTETDLNTSGKIFIYACWGDVPFKYANTF